MKRYRLISAVAAIALLVAAPAAIGSGGDGIVGGTAASPGEYPAQGWLVVDTPPAPGFDSECGGTLVGSRWFLTAAHCVVGVTAFAVLLGDNDVQLPNNDWYGVASVDVHAAYNPITNQNDVAMLRLDRAAPYQPLRVIEPSETPIWAPGTVARIVGWGATAEGGPPANLLQEADVRIVGDAPCQSAYELNAPPMDPGTMVCAAEPGRDTCQGDSGGPLMVRDSLGAWALVGITSWGQGCASPEFPGVYTRLGARVSTIGSCCATRVPPSTLRRSSIQGYQRRLRSSRSIRTPAISQRSTGISTGTGSTTTEAVRAQSSASLPGCRQSDSKPAAPAAIRPAFAGESP